MKSEQETPPTVALADADSPRLSKEMPTLDVEKDASSPPAEPARKVQGLAVHYMSSSSLSELSYHAHLLNFSSGFLWLLVLCQVSLRMRWTIRLLQILFQ